MTNESHTNTKTFGFLAAALVAGFALGELGSVGITGQATGAFGEEPELSWSYDRNFVQHCIKRDKQALNHCLLEATCQNMNADHLGKIFKQEVHKAKNLSVKGEPFYWSDLGNRGNDTAIILLNNLCADFLYWAPAKDLMEEDPKGMSKPTESPVPEDVNQVVEAHDEVTEDSLENDFSFTESDALPEAIDFGLSGESQEEVYYEDSYFDEIQEESDEDSYFDESREKPQEKTKENIVFPHKTAVCRGKICIEPKSWAKGSLISQKRCAKHFRASFRIIHGTKELASYMAKQNCNWHPRDK